ncbi:MAG: VOC family protein [Acidobacteriota bacterium]
MPYPILGLHHVTATVDQAQADLDFCLELLALRLVKKTVNFDNPHVYHFYYGDHRGTPGSIWTTFPYQGRGVRTGVKGAGQVVTTALSVPEGSLTFWRRRLEAGGVAVKDAPPRFGEEVLVATDPAGLFIELVAGTQDAREGRTAHGVSAETAIRGLHNVSLLIRAPAETLAFPARLGFQATNETAGRIRLAVNGGGPGRHLDLVHDPDAGQAENGIGTVHHVAVAIADADSQRALRDHLQRDGFKVTAVMDRQYFQSIYVREPGGVLIEVATIEPGFEADEPLSQLGQDLKLPPWEEPNRTEIVAAP